MENLDLVLDRCLTQLASGTSTLEECLARYPQYASELRPLLEAAVRLDRVRGVQPSAAFKARARAQLTLHMRAHPKRKPFFQRSVIRLAVSLAALIFAFFSVGTAFAQTAMPGDFLYQLKLVSEDIWRASSSDPLGVDLILADRRVDEMLATTGDANAYASAQAGYIEVLTRLQVYTDAESLARIQPVLISQQDMFVSAGISVPELDNAILPKEVLPTVPPSVPALTPTPIPTFVPTVLPSIVPTIVPTIFPTFIAPTVTLATPQIPPLP